MDGGKEVGTINTRRFAKAWLKRRAGGEALVAGAGGGQLNLSQQMEEVCMIISENKPRKGKTGGGWIQRKNDLKSWVRLHLPQSYILQQVKLLAQGRVCLQGGGVYSLLKGDPPTRVRHGYFPAEMRHTGTNRTLKTPIEDS